MSARNQRHVATIGRWAAAIFAGALGACATTTPALVAGDYSKPSNEVKQDEEVLSLDLIGKALAGKTEKLRSPRPGVWHMSVDGVPVLFIAEPARVRILAPIFSLEKLSSSPDVERGLLMRLLQANFDRAVDARYALFGQTVFASVTYTREALAPTDIERFLDQVVNLHKNTFRTGDRGYSSLPPEPGSIEIDPREDDTLVSPPREPSLAVTNQTLFL